MSREERQSKNRKKSSNAFPEIAFQPEQEQSNKQGTIKQSGLGENSLFLASDLNDTLPSQTRNQFAPTLVNIRSNRNKKSKARRNNSASNISPGLIKSGIRQQLQIQD